MGRRTPPQNPSPRPLEEDILLQRLDEVLSEDELRRVLASALLVLNDDARKQLLARLGPETGATLGTVLSPLQRSARRSQPAAPVAGKGKLRQEWDRLWEQWAEVVESTGDERGKYILQEAHWEPPYVDTTSISDDLDAIASRMRPLIPRVITDQIAPDFSFAEALDALDDDLYKGLPDWMEPGGRDPFQLGPEVTSCLLAWEWSVAQRDRRDAPAFLDDIRDLEQRLQTVELDDRTIETFVLGLSDEHRRAVLESMTQQRASKRWADAFTQAYGCWAEILLDLSQRWDLALHAERSRANIPQDWTLAVPLIQDAVKRKAYTEAATLIDEALRSRLSLEKKDRWDPREQLLIHRDRFHHGDEQDTKLATLFRLWREAAEAQGQADTAAALALQITALHEADKGDVILEAFRAVSPQLQKVREALFADWRRLIVERTLQTWGSGPRVACGDWVAALVDAARAGPEGAPAFHAAVRAALDEARAAPAVAPSSTGRYSWSTLGRSSSPLFALALLTQDLDATAPTLKKRAPKLFKLLSAEVRSERERDRVDATRRTWCARLGGPSLLPELLAFWRDVGVRFVPDPGTAMGGYEQSADWLAAVHEINPTAAGELLARWGETHWRKRNLWRDLAQRGFPAPPGVRKPR